jgi:hypothetical protein
LFLCWLCGMNSYKCWKDSKVLCSLPHRSDKLWWGHAHSNGECRVCGGVILVRGSRRQCLALLSGHWCEYMYSFAEIISSLFNYGSDDSLQEWCIL